MKLPRWVVVFYWNTV